MKLNGLAKFAIAVLLTKNVCGQQSEQQPFIKIEGDVKQSLTLYRPDLEKMKAVNVKFQGHDSVSHEYTGVAVHEILSQAGVTLGKQLRGKNLSKYLIVKAADGYQVIFSLAELDTAFNNKEIILAYRMDDKPIPTNPGPFRLIVADEKKFGRSCREVLSFVVRYVKD